jgi:Outer membrane protein beta-barrel domain
MKNSIASKSICKNTILLVVILFASTISYAQMSGKESFFRMGAKAGVNINKIDGKSYNTAFNYNFQAGVFAQFNITKKIGIQPEVNFVQMQSEFTDDANNIYDDLFGGGTQHKAKLNYLEVPVLLNINIGPTQKVKLQVGPSYGGLLKQTVDSLKTATGNLYKNGEWSAIGGLWIQLPLINLSARYKLGLSDVNGINDAQTWKNQAIQISVGVTF